MKINILLLLLLVMFSLPVYAQEELEDGTYDAVVSTSSGTYTVPVEVENGEVGTVNWPNGGNMHVYGADINGTSASGTTSRGDYIDIEIQE